jgi:ribose transport system permease protein
MPSSSDLTHLRRSLLPSTIIFLFSAAVLAFLEPWYFTPESLGHNLSSLLPLCFLAVGQTLVVLTGGIDISLGTMLTLSSVVMVSMFGDSPGSGLIGASILSGLLVAVLAGVVNGFCNCVLGLQPMIATFASSFLWGGISLWIMPQPGGTVPSTLTDFVHGQFVLPTAAWILMALALFWILFYKTKFCRQLYAVGGNSASAHVSGISVRKVRFLAYALAGLMTGLGALFMVSDLGTADPLIGGPLVLSSIVAAVLGGNRLSGGEGGAIGSIVGVLILTSFRNIVFGLGLPYLWQPLIDGLIVMVALSGPQLASIGRRRLAWKH